MKASKTGPKRPKKAKIIKKGQKRPKRAQKGASGGGSRPPWGGSFGVLGGGPGGGPEGGGTPPLGGGPGGSKRPKKWLPKGGYQGVQVFDPFHRGFIRSVWAGWPGWGVQKAKKGPKRGLRGGSDPPPGGVPRGVQGGPRPPPREGGVRDLGACKIGQKGGFFGPRGVKKAQKGQK